LQQVGALQLAAARQWSHSAGLLSAAWLLQAAVWKLVGQGQGQLPQIGLLKKLAAQMLLAAERQPERAACLQQAGMLRLVALMLLLVERRWLRADFL